MKIKNDGDFLIPVAKSRLVTSLFGDRFVRIDIPVQYVSKEDNIITIGMSMEIPEAEIIEDDE